MRLSVFAATLALMATPAMAQDEGWSGEGSFSASTSSGNTDTTQLGLGVDMEYTQGRWSHGIVASADYGETDGLETQNRFQIAGNVDVQMTDRMFGFGQGQYESDEFSAYDSRLFIGGGLGYDIFDSEDLTWSVRGGPSFKVDEIREVSSGGVVTTAGETRESVSFLANSTLSYSFNENVSFSNTTSAIASEDTTQMQNVAAVTAGLTDALSARVSFDVRHDTDPRPGFESTDTTTKVSLVYNFGG